MNQPSIGARSWGNVCCGDFRFAIIIAHAPRKFMIDSTQKPVPDGDSGAGAPQRSSGGDGRTPASFHNLDITLSALRDFAYVFDLEGRFLYANRALLDLWGMSWSRPWGRTSLT